MSERRGTIIQSSHRFHGPCSACGDGDTAMKYHDHEPPPPSYTLAELRELSKEYLATSQLTDTLTPELILLSLLAWLGKKEREGNERNL